MTNIVMFDGPDGVGKTDLVNAVYAKFSNSVTPLAKLSFPSTTLRERSKSGKFYLSAREFLLDIAGGLGTALATHRRIICDRSFVSTMAYQGCTMDMVKEHLPPILFNDRMTSINLFRLYLPSSQLTERLRRRNTDVSLGLKGASGISDEPPTDEAIFRLDERFRMVYETIGKTDPWQFNPRFRIFTVDMSPPAEVCLEKVSGILESLLF